MVSVVPTKALDGYSFSQVKGESFGSYIRRNKEAIECSRHMEPPPEHIWWCSRVVVGRNDYEESREFLIFFNEPYIYNMWILVCLSTKKFCYKKKCMRCFFNHILINISSKIKIYVKYKFIFVFQESKLAVSFISKLKIYMLINILLHDCILMR